MTWRSFWRSVGRDVEHAATGVASFANHVVGVVESLGGDAVKVAHEGGVAVSSVGSSLSMPLAIAAAGVVGFFLLKR